MKKYFKGFLVLVFALQLQACGEHEIPDPNPGGFGGVDFSININQNPYTVLQKTGGSIIVSDKKVIIARLDGANWATLQSNCPSDPNSNLTYNPANFSFVCGKDNTVYDYTGKGSSGNLKRYNNTFSTNTGVLRVFE